MKVLMSAEELEAWWERLFTGQDPWQMFKDMTINYLRFGLTIIFALLHQAGKRKGEEHGDRTA